jgi:hypothetical protein
MTIRRIAARPESNSQGLWINQRVMRRECRRLLIRRVVRKIVITGAPWRIRAAGGTRGRQAHDRGQGHFLFLSAYLGGEFTHQQDLGQITGPSGFTCRSFSTAASGDKLLYSGACMHPPHNIPFFEWAPQHKRAGRPAHTLDP